MRRALAVLLLAGCSDPRPSAKPSEAALSPLVGVWRVVRFCDDDSTGKIYEPVGSNPTGYFIYTPGGQLSIQVMRSPAERPVVPDPTAETYFGYYGTYQVTSDSTVVHRVVGGTDMSQVGTDQNRVYQIRGDTLTIGSSRATWPCRLLIRVPNESPPLDGPPDRVGQKQ